VTPSTQVAPCPRCQKLEGKWLPYTSELGDADSFCCAACGHIWETDKLETRPAKKA